MTHLSTVTTRLAFLSDVPSIAPLFDAYRQFYEQASDVSLAYAFLRERVEKKESILIVAQSVFNAQNHTLGFCQLYPTFCSVAAAPIYTLYDLYVTPTSRQQGVGKRLLLAAERHAVQQGYARIELTTAKSNAAAQALYASLGWVRDEVFDAYSKTLQPAS